MTRQQITIEKNDIIPKIGEWYTMGANNSPQTQYIGGALVQIKEVKIIKGDYDSRNYVEAVVVDAAGKEYYAPTSAVRSMYQVVSREEKKKKLTITTTIEEG